MQEYPPGGTTVHPRVALPHLFTLWGNYKCSYSTSWHVFENPQGHEKNVQNYTQTITPGCSGSSQKPCKCEDKKLHTALHLCVIQ